MTDTHSFQLSWRLSQHARRLLTLALAGLAIGITTGRPVFAGVAAPAILLLAGWRRQRPREVTVTVDVARQLVEGDEAAAGVAISGYGDYTVRARLHASAGYTIGVPQRLGSAAGYAVRVPFRAGHWGMSPVGTLEVTLWDRLRLSEGRALIALPRTDCYPLPAGLRGRMSLNRLPSRHGERTSRAAGEGIEFAGVRQFVPGDRQRRINWAATTRSGTLQLNTFAVERTQNVVVLADATADIGEPGATSLDLAFRGAAGAINRYLAGGDRVGLIVYAATLSWIGPGMGRRHFHRLMDLLLSSERGWDGRGGLRRLPKAALPPGALVLAFTPLLDSRLAAALRDLRERGFTVLVVDVATAEPEPSRSQLVTLARRIWRLEQQAVRFTLTEAGIPVVRWDGQVSLDEPLAPYTQRVMLAGRA